MTPPPEAALQLARSLATLRPSAPPPKLHLLTPDGASWLLHSPGWWPATPAQLDELWRARPPQPTLGTVMGRAVAFPRRTAAYGEDYAYTGQTQRAAPLAAAPPLAAEACAALASLPPLAGHAAALLNWYDAAAGEYMGAHADDERALRRGEPIVSLSWADGGHFRRFRLTPRKEGGGGLAPALPGGGGRAGVAAVRNGCLLVMGGTTQRTHKHELMKPTKAPGEGVGRRVNLSLRCFAGRAGKRGREEGGEAEGREEVKGGEEGERRAATP
ncbi:hypothetical protein AB1Y20_017049 [Prymnesium parvum]|uniref:Fe2OG dioxygenase domain-containing protein n=1 Tax=Prymnesium parvum TaxID=97485 RepID=A0AB34IC80_PRYPA